jgi:hypothetical protein
VAVVVFAKEDMLVLPIVQGMMVHLIALVAHDLDGASTGVGERLMAAPG